MTALKLAGAALIAGAGGAAGLCRALAVGCRVRILADLITALGVLKEEICVPCTPLPGAFSLLAACSAGRVGDFFTVLALRAGEGPLRDVWAGETEKLPLSAEERAAVSALGLSLGRYDAQRQAGAIDLAVSRLGRFLAEEREESRTRGKMYFGVGVSLGAMLAAILY